MISRYQPPAHSPVRLTGLVEFLGDDPSNRLENLIQERYGVEKVALLASGTQALTRACASLASRVDSPGVVAMPSYGCFDIGTAAVGADARIRFYDLDPVTLGPEPASLAQVIREGVDAVLVTPLYGLAVDWHAIRDVLSSSPSEPPLLIEDAAQAFGAMWEGEPVGSHGDLSILSFGRGKGWTGGGGGALLYGTRSTHGDDCPVTTEKAKPPHGAPILAKSAVQRIFGRPTLYGIPARLPFLSLGQTLYHPPEPLRPMAPMSAALALVSFDAALREAETRTRNARLLRQRLGEELGQRWGTDFRPPDEVEGSRPSYLRLPVLTPSGMAGFRDRRTAERSGIMPAYPKPLPKLTPLADLTLSAPPPQLSEEIVRRLVTVPTHSFLRKEDLDAIAGAFAQYRP